MKLAVTSVVTLICLSYGVAVRADCPLDHLLIGCNRDGVEGTDDDTKLFVDCSQKYRDSGETDHANWFYPLQKSIFSSYGYRIGEPGFADQTSLLDFYDARRTPDERLAMVAAALQIEDSASVHLWPALDAVLDEFAWQTRLGSYAQQLKAAVKIDKAADRTEAIRAVAKRIEREMAWLLPKPADVRQRDVMTAAGLLEEHAARVVERQGFPAPRKLTMGRVWSDEDVTAWEAAEHEAGRAIPGESPRGYRAGDGPPRGGRRS